MCHQVEPRMGTFLVLTIALSFYVRFYHKKGCSGKIPYKDATCNKQLVTTLDTQTCTTFKHNTISTMKVFCIFIKLIIGYDTLDLKRTTLMPKGKTFLSRRSSVT